MTAREQGGEVDGAARLRVTTDALAMANAQAERWKVRHDEQRRRAERAEDLIEAGLALADEWEREARCLGRSLSELMLRDGANRLRAALTGADQ